MKRRAMEGDGGQNRANTLLAESVLPLGASDRASPRALSVSGSWRGSTSE